MYGDQREEKRGFNGSNAFIEENHPRNGKSFYGNKVPFLWLYKE